MDFSPEAAVATLEETLRGCSPSGRQLREARLLIKAWSRSYKEVGLAPILPLLFRLRGRPYNLNQHFPMKPLFRIHKMARKVIMKCGRQVSKCCAISGFGSVLLANGRPVAGTNLVVGDRVLALDDQTLKVVSGTVRRTYRPGARACLRLTTRLGAVLDVADTHPIRTFDGYTPAGQLKVGDVVAHARAGGQFTGSAVIPTARTILTALMLGDGCCGVSKNFSFTSAGPEAAATFCALTSELGSPPKKRKKPQNRASSYCLSLRHPLRQWLTEDGLWGCSSPSKHLPAWVFDLDRQSTTLFIRYLWSTDGMVKARKNGLNISYCSTSRELSYGLRSLLLKFGIVASVKRRKTKRRPAYILRVEGQTSQRLFCQLFDVPDKPAPAVSFNEERSNRDTLPDRVRGVISRCCEPLAHKHQHSLRQAGLRQTPKYRPTTAKVRQYIDWLNSNGLSTKPLQQLVDSDIFWDVIEQVERIESAECWDIEVDQHHNYLLDGVVCHNSTTLAHQGTAQSIIIPYFNTLFLTPLYEQVRRFSSNYVREAIRSCVLYDQIVDRGSAENVLQRSLQNRSTMFFSFAFRDCERVRGLNVDSLKIDEFQGMDKTFLPVIMETMSASPWALLQLSGTPMSMDNGMEEQWQLSSMGEWAIKCEGCNYTNVCSVHQDLMKMLGREGLICAKCGKPVNTERGYWLHAIPERRATYLGYHAPQPIFPMHCRSYSKWRLLLDKVENLDEYSVMTEVMGESWDAGAKMVTLADLKRACVLPWKNDAAAAAPHATSRRHQFRVLAIDWSGGGAKEESLTAMAVLGVRIDGKIEVVWMKKYPHSADYYADAMRAIQAFKQFNCSFLAHDFGGAGAGREQILVHAGFPLDKVVPVSLVRAHAQKAMMHYNPPGTDHVRHSYSLDKARSLVYTSELIKVGYLEFPEFESSQPCIKDFLALIEETIQTPRGSDLFLIGKSQGVPDDVAQAINIGVCSIYHRLQKWPNIAGMRSVNNALRALRDADPSLIDPETVMHSGTRLADL